MTMASQTAHPWRTTARTILQLIIAVASGAPLIWQAATQQDPAAATGGAAVVLLVAGAITRVMALPFVNEFLRRFLPFLAPDDAAPVGAKGIRNMFTAKPLKLRE